MTEQLNALTVVRVINASADELYAAWTDPAIMRRWMATIVDADVRVGGRYRITIHEDDGSVNTFTGEYRVLEPGKRLVKTFRHHSANPGEYEDEYVDVTFRALGPRRTELTLVNGWSGRPVTAEEQDGMREGFRVWLDQLEAALT
ncbi:MAG TPA: SRPBCC domain-containing protein [Gemmatimonadaceae bacterium]|nr:SRPBCC domain-containing protein [Gemmatimonadaceae bacterium]